MCIVLPNYSFSRILAHIVWFDQDSRDFFVKHYTVKRKAEITVNIHSSRLWNSRYIQAKVYVYHPNFRVCAQRKVPVKRFKISHYTKIQSCFFRFTFRVKVLYFFPQMNGTAGHKIWQIQVLIWYFIKHKSWNWEDDSFFDKCTWVCQIICLIWLNQYLFLL